MKRIVIFCTSPDGRHRWEWVRGFHATVGHAYRERRCARCGQYESGVR
jgi:hypothetical protein